MSAWDASGPAVSPPIFHDDHVGGRSSVVERQLPKLNVVGSIPIARSKAFPL